MRSVLGLFTVLALCTACRGPAAPPAAEQTPAARSASDKATADAGAHEAHEAYVTAINSNNLEMLLGVLTKDVVFLSAHEPAMVGKAAVRPWLEGYLKAYVLSRTPDGVL